MTAGPAILIVEDEAHVQTLVLRCLRDAGHRGIVAVSRTEMLDAMEHTKCAAVILDLGLPGDDGLELLRLIRERSRIPVLILTGRAGIRQRVQGLEAGADDYLTKPFAPEELVARLRAILRRASPAGERGTVDVAVKVGDARLDLRTRVIAGPGGEEKLTEREARIVSMLARVSTPLSRAALSRDVLGREWNPLDRSLDVHMSHLRRKLETVLGQVGVLATIRAEGYELRVPTRFETEG